MFFSNLHTSIASGLSFSRSEGAPGTSRGDDFKASGGDCAFALPASGDLSWSGGGGDIDAVEVAPPAIFLSDSAIGLVISSA